MLTQVAKNIYTFPVTLLNNPLKWLNCYIIRGDKRSLLIDSGFNHPKCLAQLRSALKEFELSPDNTDVLFTHMHSDHTGNATPLQELGFRLLMTQTDHERLMRIKPELVPEEEGMPREILATAKATNAAVKYMSKSFECDYVSDGEHIIIGDHDYEIIVTPGHTPGHICLYDKDRKIMLTGDHVLFDITPNICSWGKNGGDALGEYLKSLEHINNYEVELALPSHRNTSSLTLQTRIVQLQRHHENRLNELRTLILRYPESTAYDLTGHMTWDIRAKDWDSFPAAQKWFAVSEALAHIDHLVYTGEVLREKDDRDINRYRLA